MQTQHSPQRSLTFKRVFVNLSLSNDRRKRGCSGLKILVFNLMPRTQVYFQLEILVQLQERKKTMMLGLEWIGSSGQMGSWFLTRIWPFFHRHGREGQENGQMLGAWQGCWPEHVEVDPPAECLISVSFPLYLPVELSCPLKSTLLQ